MSRVLSGGCQCGAVRFRVTDPHNPGFCHCRMCQKAFGNFFAALVEATVDTVEWTRGEPAYFQSSKTVRRGFCRDCGTPLTYSSGTGVELAIGAFDDPEAVVPDHQVNHSARLSFFDKLPNIPADDESAYSDFQAGLASFQHPDHDTPEWPIRHPKP